MTVTVFFSFSNKYFHRNVDMVLQLRSILIPFSAFLEIFSSSDMLIVLMQVTRFSGSNVTWCQQETAVTAASSKLLLEKTASYQAL